MNNILYNNFDFLYLIEVFRHLKLYNYPYSKPLTLFKFEDMVINIDCVRNNLVYRRNIQVYYNEISISQKIVNIIENIKC